MKYIPFILFTVMTNAAAQLMLKYGMMQLGELTFAGANPILKLLQIVFSPWIFFGLCVFVISMASHLYVLSKVDLSFAYPFLSLAYVAVAVFAYYLFAEDLNALRIAGIGFICIGTVLIAQSGRERGVADNSASIAQTSVNSSELNSMRHVIFGGDGFVGRHLAQKLANDGEDVVVADVVRSDLSHYGRVGFVHCDVTKPEDIAALGLKGDDMVYNLSAKMLSPIQVRAKRHDFFFPVNYDGAVNIIRAMDRAGADKLVHFTTDMIYGHTVFHPMTEDHPVAPLGEYGLSKLKTEELAQEWRNLGMSISLFRPRLIIGPGRLGILEKLFKLIDWNLPVPMIGSGRNPYQFISVFDCAKAARLAWKAGVPNEAYNLGSLNPPPVRKLLGDLIRHAGSHSFLLPTPGWAVKRTLDLFDLLNIPIMDPEQYLIADEMCVLDVSKGERDLGWVPQYDDADMLIAAYDEYRARRQGADIAPAAHVAAE